MDVFAGILSAGRPTARQLLGLMCVLVLTGCATSSIERDRARLAERLSASYGISVGGVRLEPVPAPATSGLAAGEVIDRWPEIREREYGHPRELRVEMERMVSDVDRLSASMDSRALMLSGAEAIRWREANEQLRQARARLDAQLGNYETAPPDRRDEIKREIEDAWRRTRQSLEALQAGTPE